MEHIDYESRIKDLEKTVRVLTKKLERSQADRQQLESASELREAVLKNVIKELEESQIVLERRTKELESTLANLQDLQVKMIESEKMSALGVLVAGIAHEINNPVNFIYGNLEHANAYFQDLLGLIDLYQESYPQPTAPIKEEIELIELDYIREDSQKIFKSMNIGAERIREIVQSLRTFSRLDEAEFKKVDIHEGIDSALVILNHRLQPTPENPHGIKVICDYGRLPLIECYSGQLNQVFLNIIVNAIDALESGLKTQKNNQEHEKILLPNIHISTHVNNEWISIYITDNGPGISREVQPKLFDPFFTTKEVGKGTGLGLSICYKVIVELHGGKLECHSAPGAGAEFHIQIPIQHSPIQHSRINAL
ncbi:MAG: ATP-binding protein [Nostocaceae cyanobacterium]|nr:ATP-binding protein [Nostocaceae cyanobacterium]